MLLVGSYYFEKLLNAVIWDILMNVIKNKSTKKLSALVVEDSIVNQKQLDIHLKIMGFNVEFVDNGLDAIDKINSMRFDLVFLDIMIPKLNGYKVCKIIKKNPQTKGVPIIMLTSRDGTFDKVRGKMAGTNDYLTKPLQVKSLLDTVSKYFPIQDGKLTIGIKETQTKIKTPINTNIIQINRSQYSGMASKLLQHKNDSALAMQKAKQRVEHFRRLADS